MKRSVLTAAAVFAAMAGRVAVCAATGNVEDAGPAPQQILSTEISGSDLVFFTGAAPQIALMGGLSQLAKSRAVTPEVRTLAATVWKEQTDAAARLKELTARKRVPLGVEPDGRARKLLQRLGTLNGVKFDKSFLDALQDAQDLLQASLLSGAASADVDIKAFARAALETLLQERHRVKRLGI